VVQLADERELEPLRLVVPISAKARVRVIDARGQPVDQCQVYSLGEGGAHFAEPQGLGVFVLAGLELGAHTIYAYDARSLPATVKVSVQHDLLPELLLALPARDTNLRGRVLDADGRELADAWVRVSPTGFQPLGLQTSKGSLTAADGSFDVPGLASGDYDIEVAVGDGEPVVQPRQHTGTNVVIRLAAATPASVSQQH
jgi:hypothetical protein